MTNVFQPLYSTLARNHVIQSGCECHVLACAYVVTRKNCIFTSFI